MNTESRLTHLMRILLHFHSGAALPGLMNRVISLQNTVFNISPARRHELHYVTVNWLTVVCKISQNNFASFSKNCTVVQNKAIKTSLAWPCAIVYSKASQKAETVPFRVEQNGNWLAAKGVDSYWWTELSDLTHRTDPEFPSLPGIKLRSCRNVSQREVSFSTFVFHLQETTEKSAESYQRRRLSEVAPKTELLSV